MLGYGVNIKLSTTLQEGDVWYSPMYELNTPPTTQPQQVPVPNAPSGSYYVSLDINGKVMAKSEPFVVDFNGKCLSICYLTSLTFSAQTLK